MPIRPGRRPMRRRGRSPLGQVCEEGGLSRPYPGPSEGEPMEKSSRPASSRPSGRPAGATRSRPPTTRERQTGIKNDDTDEIDPTRRCRCPCAAASAHDEEDRHDGREPRRALSTHEVRSRGHSDTWAGCMVSATTARSSAVSVSRSTSSRSARAERLERLGGVVLAPEEPAVDGVLDAGRTGRTAPRRPESRRRPPSPSRR